jgi:tyrosyl-DNA phosphodiesterase 1
MSENPAKRRKIDDSENTDGKLPRTLQREISPPPFRRRTRKEAGDEKAKTSLQEQATQEQGDQREVKLPTEAAAPLDDTIRSPFRLTAIRGLDPICNIDAVTLDDLLGGLDLTEAWLFDYMYDLDFCMSAFAPRIRDTVAVKIVHGSWQDESSQRMHLENRAKHYPNVEVICAWMPERFGTHHSKMMVLFTAASARVVVRNSAN